MPERSYGGLVTIAHFKGIDPRRFVLILCSTPPHSNSSQPIPAKVCAKHRTSNSERFVTHFCFLLIQRHKDLIRLFNIGMTCSTQSRPSAIASFVR